MAREERAGEQDPAMIERRGGGGGGSGGVGGGAVLGAPAVGRRELFPGRSWGGEEGEREV